MKRQLLLDLLKNYYPSDSQELKAKDEIILFVENNENCFERSLTSGHITASAFLLNKTQTHALLMHHAKLDCWVQLGGHCDGDHDVIRVALKEAQEESGIINIAPIIQDIFDLDIHLIPENPKEKAHYHYDIRFLLKVISDENFVQNSESKALQWFDKDINKLPTQSRSIIRMFHKWNKLEL